MKRLMILLPLALIGCEQAKPTKAEVKVETSPAEAVQVTDLPCGRMVIVENGSVTVFQVGPYMPPEYAEGVTIVRESDIPSPPPFVPPFPPSGSPPLEGADGIPPPARRRPPPEGADGIPFVPDPLEIPDPLPSPFPSATPFPPSGSAR